MYVHTKSRKVRDKMKTDALGISSILKDRFTKPVKKTGGATYSWQDHAVRVAQKLGIEPDKQWFKCFKINKEGLLDRTASWVYDYSCTDKRMMFYWGLNQFKKYGKIVGKPEGR